MSKIRRIQPLYAYFRNHIGNARSFIRWKFAVIIFQFLRMQRLLKVDWNIFTDSFVNYTDEIPIQTSLEIRNMNVFFLIDIILV